MFTITDVLLILLVFFLANNFVVSPINGYWMLLTGQDIPPPETYSQKISKYWEFFTPWNYMFLTFLAAFFVASYKQQFGDMLKAIVFAIQFIGRVASILFTLVPAAPERDPNLVDAPNPRPAKTWKVNAKVTAPYKETGKRFHATVIEDFNDGTYRIAWKDRDLTDTRKKGEELRRRN